MEPIVEKITLVEDARFDSPKSMFLGRVMGKNLTLPLVDEDIFISLSIIHALFYPVYSLCLLLQRSVTLTMRSRDTTHQASLAAYPG